MDRRGHRYSMAGCFLILNDFFFSPIYVYSGLRTQCKTFRNQSIGATLLITSSLHMVLMDLQ